MPFLTLDLPAMLTGTLAAVLCGLVGNFLVLRKQALLGDAIAHAVLPGLVTGFLLTGSRATLPMIVGAAAAGVIAAGLIELVRRAARLESGAAMGVVFASMFALGVLLIEQAGARGVDLDPDCVLTGQLERVFWLPPAGVELFSRAGLEHLPRELLTLAAATALATALIALFYKELRLVCFDPALATSLGIPAGRFGMGIVLVVALAVVVSFEAVGSILVVAMLVTPAAIARLLTDRFRTQLLLSALVAAAAGILGYLLAARAPSLIDVRSVSAAGMIALVGGVILAAAVILSPTQGLLARARRARTLRSTIAREDLLAMLYRLEETSTQAAITALDPRALAHAVARGEVTLAATRPALSPKGRQRAQELVRAHRLWESFLVSKAGLRPDHVHDRAMELEHLTELNTAVESTEPIAQDPHGKPIPPPPHA